METIERLTRRCQNNCGSEVSLPMAKYCDPCRSLRRRKTVKYVFNETIDAQIKRAYSERLDRRSSEVPNLRQIAKRFNMPHWAIRKRAGALGLTRQTDDRDWTEAELRILERWAWMCPDRIRLKLKSAGFERTATAIQLKVKRCALKQNTPYVNANILAQCFGVDRHAIARWIRLKWLKADKQGDDGSDPRKWMIHERDVKEFILSHPLQFDIRKVDQLWFLNLITDGKVCL